MNHDHHFLQNAAAKVMRKARQKHMRGAGSVSRDRKRNVVSCAKCSGRQHVRQVKARTSFIGRD